MIRYFKTLIICFFGFLFFGCCFDNPEIVIWEYNKDLESELIEKNKVSNLSHEICKEGLSISFKDFSEFDNVKKIFKFKSKEKAETIQKKIWNITSRDEYNYFFSIVRNDRILLSGYFISSTNISAYENKNDRFLRMFFTQDCNLRIASDSSFQSFDTLVELFDTKEIESLLPIKYKKNLSDGFIYKNGDEYYIYLDERNLLIDVCFKNSQVEYISICDLNKKFSENYCDFEDQLQHWISTNDYSEITFVSKKQSSKEYPAVKKMITLENGKTVELNIFSNGTINAKKDGK